MNQEKIEHSQITQSGSAGRNLNQTGRDHINQRGSNNRILIPIMIIIFGGAAGALYFANSQTNGGPTQEQSMPVESISK